jgi:hypothetical protein
MDARPFGRTASDHPDASLEDFPGRTAANRVEKNCG